MRKIGYRNLSDTRHSFVLCPLVECYRYEYDHAWRGLLADLLDTKMQCFPMYESTQCRNPCRGFPILFQSFSLF